MPSSASTAECTEHVLSIEPTREELTAFHALHVELLSPEDFWPLPVVNFIHRWMHRHSFYQISPSKASTLLALTSTLMLLAKLPATDDIKEKVTQKCASLIAESALKWEEGGLLRQRGHGLGKRKLLKDIWAAYVDRFREIETTVLGEVSAEGRQGDNSFTADGEIRDHSGSMKREANTHLSRDIAKIPRTDDGAQEKAKREEAALHREYEMPGPNRDIEDCIIVDIGESSVAEVHLTERLSPCVPDTSNHESPLGHSTDNRGGTSPSKCTEEGVVIPFQPLSPHEASDVLNTRQDQIQEVARNRATSDQRSSTGVADENAAQSSPAPEATPPHHPSTIVPNSYRLCSPEQAPEMQSNSHIPQRSSIQQLISTSSIPPDSSCQSGHSQESRPQISTNSSIASVGMRAYPLGTGPSDPDSPGFSPDHVKHVRPGDPATLEPLITIERPLSTPTSNPPQICPTSRDYAMQNPRPPIQPLIEARPTDRSQLFRAVGRVLTPDYDRPGTWSLLHVDTLMSCTMTDFYGLFSRLVQPGRALPDLRFEILDAAPELAPELSYPVCISCGDYVNFRALQKYIFGCFKATIANYPTLQMFRIMVTPDIAPLSRQVSVGVRARGPGSGLSGSQVPALGSNSSIVRLAPLEPRLGPQDAPTRRSSNAPTPIHPTFLEGRESHVPSQGTKYNEVVARVNSLALPVIIVRIQIDKYGSVSKPFPKFVIAPKVTNADFFAWFAKQTGYGGPLGPAELSFAFKDVVPAPKNNVITRGNEEYFEYMKRDIRPMCETTMAKIPGLSEFTILVTVPGWVAEKQNETW